MGIKGRREKGDRAKENKTDPENEKKGRWTKR